MTFLFLNSSFYIIIYRAFHIYFVPLTNSKPKKKKTMGYDRLGPSGPSNPNQKDPATSLPELQKKTKTKLILFTLAVLVVGVVCFGIFAGIRAVDSGKTEPKLTRKPTQAISGSVYATEGIDRASKALFSPAATSAATLASCVALCASIGPPARSPIAKMCGTFVCICLSTGTIPRSSTLTPALSAASLSFKLADSLLLEAGSSLKLAD